VLEATVVLVRAHCRKRQVLSGAHLLSLRKATQSCSTHSWRPTSSACVHSATSVPLSVQGALLQGRESFTVCLGTCVFHFGGTTAKTAWQNGGRVAGGRRAGKVCNNQSLADRQGRRWSSCGDPATGRRQGTATGNKLHGAVKLRFSGAPCHVPLTTWAAIEILLKRRHSPRHGRAAQRSCDCSRCA